MGCRKTRDLKNNSAVAFLPVLPIFSWIVRSKTFALSLPGRSQRFHAMMDITVVSNFRSQNKKESTWQSFWEKAEFSLDSLCLKAWNPFRIPTKAAWHMWGPTKLSWTHLNWVPWLDEQLVGRSAHRKAFSGPATNIAQAKLYFTFDKSLGSGIALVPMVSVDVNDIGAGFLWKGFETYSQISLRNMASVSADWVSCMLHHNWFAT